MLETGKRVCEECGEPITDDSEFCRWCGSFSPTSAGSTIAAGIGVAHLERGYRLGRYLVEGLLARGAMGVVYRAHDESLDRHVAIKVVAPEFAGDRDLRRRFEQEAVAAARIEHPGILPVYAIGEEQGTLFIVSRLVEGPNLKTLVEEKGTLEPVLAADIVNQLGLAIDAAHTGGVLHRDIKPANVLLSADREGGFHAYLADFGLSKLVAEEAGLTRTGEVVGSADYLAPEQINRGPLDERTDLYALGCLAYFCLNGTPPFRRGTVPATMWAHLHEAPPELDPAYRDSLPLLQKALARSVSKDPEERFTNGAALGRAMSEALALSGSKTPPPVSPPGQKPEAATPKPKVQNERKNLPASISGPRPDSAPAPGLRDPGPKATAKGRPSRRPRQLALLALGSTFAAIAALLFTVGPLDRVVGGDRESASPKNPAPKTLEERQREARDEKLREQRKRKQKKLIEQSQALAGKGKGLRGKTLKSGALTKGIRAAKRAKAQARAGKFRAASRSLRLSRRLIAQAESARISYVPPTQQPPPPGQPEGPDGRPGFDGGSGGGGSGGGGSGGGFKEVPPNDTVPYP